MKKLITIILILITINCYARTFEFNQLEICYMIRYEEIINDLIKDDGVKIEIIDEYPHVALVGDGACNMKDVVLKIKFFIRDNVCGF